jgi:hypothetical protein
MEEDYYSKKFANRMNNYKIKLAIPSPSDRLTIRESMRLTEMMLL